MVCCLVNGRMKSLASETLYKLVVCKTVILQYKDLLT